MAQKLKNIDGKIEGIVYICQLLFAEYKRVSRDNELMQAKNNQLIALLEENRNEKIELEDLITRQMTEL